MGEGSKPVWTMRDGTKIAIKDMGDQHIINTIRFLDRAAERIHEQAIMDGFSALSAVNGEQARYSIEDGIASLEQDGSDPYDEFPIYEHLVAEASRRGLSLTPAKPEGLA